MSLADFFAKENKVVFNLKLLTGEEHTQENFTGTINMFVDNYQYSGEIEYTGVRVGTQEYDSSKYYTAKYKGVVNGYFNIVTANNLGGGVFKLYDENNFNFAIWPDTSPNAYFSINYNFYVSGYTSYDNIGNGIFGNLTRVTSLPKGYSFG